MTERQISHYIYTPSVTFRDFDVVFSYAVRLNSAATRIDQLKARLSRDIQFQKLFDDAYGVHEFLNGWYMECAFRYVSVFFKILVTQQSLDLF